MDSSNSPTIEKTIYEKPEFFLKQFMREDYSSILYFNSTTRPSTMRLSGYSFIYYVSGLTHTHTKVIVHNSK